MRSSRLLAMTACAGLLTGVLAGCSSSGDSAPAAASPAVAASSPAASAVASPMAALPSGAPSLPFTAGDGFDAPGLVKAMWDLLGDSSKTMICDLHKEYGDEAGSVFLSAVQSDPQASRLTKADEANVVAAAATLLRTECAKS